MRGSCAGADPIARWGPMATLGAAICNVLCERWSGLAPVTKPHAGLTTIARQPGWGKRRALMNQDTCLSVNRWGSTWAGTPAWAGPPQAGTPPGQVHSPGRYTNPPPGQVHTPHPPTTVHARIRSASGRYASHWNAFLLLSTFVVVLGTGKTELPDPLSSIIAEMFLIVRLSKNFKIYFHLRV